MSVARRMTLPRRKIRRTADHEVFEKEFAIESLKSERLRVTILMGAIFSSVALLLLLTLLFYEQFNATFRGNARMFLVAVAVLFGVNIGYLLAERIILDRLIKNQIKTFPALKYLSAFVETSIPTAGIIIGSFFLGIHPSCAPQQHDRCGLESTSRHGSRHAFATRSLLE